MAKIETTFIRPKELYTPETGETQVVYDGYQNNPHELVVEENLEGEVSEIVNDTFVPNEGGNVVFTDNNETEHELITEDGFAGALDTAMPTALAKAQVIETTWQELKDKRDNGQLIAGSLYRITDYNCTTTQENTQSAGHQFDIVLLALSENKLAEEGWAMEHPTDVYDVTFEDGVKKCYFWIKEIRQGRYYGALVDCDTFIGNENIDLNIDIVNKKITINQKSDIILSTENVQYNYFQYSNLSAWKVWYCLDNDTNRFAWADDTYKSKVSIIYSNVEYLYKGENGPGQEWKNSNDESIFTSTNTPSSGDSVYKEFYLATVIGTVSEYKEVIDSYNGRGVIYRLIDEWNNDVAYDFKNIQFVRKLTDGEYDADNGTDTWVYTFNGWDSDNSVVSDASFDTGTNHNQITCSDLTVLEDVVMIVGDACCFNRCNDVFLCTLNKVTNTELVACNGIDGIIINAIGIYYYCSDDLSTTEFDAPAIYLNNKKVLTEE